MFMVYPMDRITTRSFSVNRWYWPDLRPNWIPPGKPSLLYQDLYRGLYEYLLQPPTMARMPAAERYLRQLKRCYHPSNTLQRDRITWTRAWLDAVSYADDSDDDTVVGQDDA